MATRLSPPPPYVPGSQTQPSSMNTTNMTNLPTGDRRQTSRPQHIDLPLGTGARMSAAPLSPVRVSTSEDLVMPPSSAEIETASSHMRTPSAEHDLHLSSSVSPSSANAASSYLSPSHPSRPPPPPQHQVRLLPGNMHNFSRPKSQQSLTRPWQTATPESPQIIATDETGSRSRLSEYGLNGEDEQPQEAPPEPLQYFHSRGLSDASAAANSGGQPSPESSGRPRSQISTLSRPMSAMMLEPGRSPSPGVSPDRARNGVYNRRSPGNRPMSYIDLLNAPYPQPAPSASNLQNETLRPAVGLNASLLSSQKTFEMYLANVKKTSDLHAQYTFATFLIGMAQEARNGTGVSRPSTSSGALDDSPSSKPQMLIDEARKILESLAGKSYPFAQYYLGDGFASGLFKKSGGPDNDRALPLFTAASKHGHAEAGYRAGLCYEFGWGTRRDGPKAWQYFRASASKGHPGAMTRLSRACLTGDLGQPISQREGVRWLKRAAEKADEQFNSAPYELGVLHEKGFGDDVFKDEAFAAQMFTRASELGHAEAAFRMGQAYEHAQLMCPRDPGLSIHFYNIAALGGHGEAMLSLAAWYLLGCEVLEKDEAEAFEWAKKSAAEEYPKGIFMVGWLRETGTGCQRDPLEANVCYVRAAELGYERARQRIKAIQAAASGGNGAATQLQPNDKKKGKKSKEDKQREKSQTRLGEEGEKEKRKKKLGIF